MKDVFEPKDKFLKNQWKLLICHFFSITFRMWYVCFAFSLCIIMIKVNQNTNEKIPRNVVIFHEVNFMFKTL